MDRPIACQLGVFDQDARRRYDELRARLQAEVMRVDELPDGYAFVLPGGDDTLRWVTEWILLERMCCAFFIFTVSIPGAEGEITVALGGGREVKQFLALELGARTIPPTSLVRR